MKQLWAPWRLEYILKSKESRSSKKKHSCVFCAVQKGVPNSKNLVLHKVETAYVMMNKFPYNIGHLMVVPKRHISDFSKLSKNEHGEMGQLMNLSMKVLKKFYKPQGFNLGLNLGQAGGAGIREHLHYHVVPRWIGDTNFMPAVSSTRIMVEHLKKSYLKLRAGF